MAAPRGQRGDQGAGGGRVAQLAQDPRRQLLHAVVVVAKSLGEQGHGAPVAQRQQRLGGPPPSVTIGATQRTHEVVYGRHSAARFIRSGLWARTIGAARGRSSSRISPTALNAPASKQPATVWISDVRVS